MANQSRNTETTQAAAPEHMIDLGIGHPGLELLPTELVRASAERELDRGDPRVLQYGFEQGSGAFREALSGFLEEATGIDAPAEELFVSAGVSQALDLLCSLFARPGDLVFVEEPTYFLALRIFEDHGLRTRSIPTDGNGLDPSALEQALDEETPRFLYTIPVHQNPSGVTLSEERRGRLVELAEQHDFLILADEVYQLLTFDGAAPAPFGRFAKGAHVCALGSFSKILAPGLRMGWIHADGELIRRIVLSGFLDSGGGLAPFSSALLQTAVADGSLLEHVAVLRDAYRRRRDALLEILGGREAEARGLRVSEPAGGYFLWAELPPGRDAGSLAEAAQTAGASFVPGPRFSSTKALSRFLRISFSYYPPEQLAEGARRLLSVL